MQNEMNHGRPGRVTRLFRAAIPIVALVLTMPAGVAAQPPRAVPRTAYEPSVVVRWNAALVEAVRRTNFRPMWTARAMAIVNTAMFDAWAAYDPMATGVAWNQEFRRPVRERTAAAVETAISWAAYRALADLFPSQVDAVFTPLMASLGLAATVTPDAESPGGVGDFCAALVLASRRDDGANQHATRGGAPYSDYTGYAPQNTADAIGDPNRWQPLRAADGTVQSFLAPHWRHVRPFALRTADALRPAAPPLYPDPRYVAEADDILRVSADLTDRDKMIAEYWADGPATETPPGHWSVLAQWVAARDRHTLGQDVVLFFALGNAMLDASIAVWDAKVAYDFARPITAVRFLYAGRTVAAWGGPGQGTRLIAGETFAPYIATPPFAEYTSGHSAFSAAAAEILTVATGSPLFGASATLRAGSSTIEPGTTPATDVVLSWPTFQDAADEAAWSRRLGGIHFESGDLASRALGRAVASAVWERVREFVGGQTRRRW